MEFTRVPSGSSSRSTARDDRRHVLGVTDVHARIVHEHGVRRGVVGQAALDVDIEHPAAKPHRRVREDRAVHQGRALDNRMKRQVREDVLLEIDARRHLGQREPRARQPKDAALRHVQHALVLLGGDASAEGRLRHRSTNLPTRPSRTIRRRPSSTAYCAPPTAKFPMKTTFLAF